MSPKREGEKKNMKKDYDALEKIRRIVGYDEEPKTISEWMRLSKKFEGESEEKLKEAVKALEEANEKIKLAAGCLMQAIIMCTGEVIE